MTISMDNLIKLDTGVLSICGSCGTRHNCYHTDGVKYYCGSCLSSPEEKEEIKVEEDMPEFEDVHEDEKQDSIVFKVELLDTGMILHYQKKRHIFTSKTSLLKHLGKEVFK